MKLFGAILTVVFAVIATGAIAAPEKFILNKDHTYVGFDVSYLMLARVSGRFYDFQGSFVINREHSRTFIQRLSRLRCFQHFFIFILHFALCRFGIFLVNAVMFQRIRIR